MESSWPGASQAVETSDYTKTSMMRALAQLLRLRTFEASTIDPLLIHHSAGINWKPLQKNAMTKRFGSEQDIVSNAPFTLRLMCQAPRVGGLG